MSDSILNLSCMKKILLAISMLLSLVACNRELIELSLPVSDDGKIVLNFNVVVPESQVATKSLSSPAIDSLTVIAFDENGYFVEAVRARCEENDKQWKVEGSTRFKVTLSQAASARRLHFVANCPKDTSAIAYGPEAEVMNSLVTGKDDNGNKQDAYWQRVEVNSLLAQNSPSLGTIYLIRNFAKIRISSIPTSLTNVSYALLNVPQSGTVAPYNENKSYFQPYLNSNTGKEYSDLKTDQYEGFLPRNVELDAKSSDVDSDSDLNWQSFDPNDEEGGIYAYESPASNNTAVLIKGLYGAKTCYYKIDLIDEDSKENYNILRNIEYIVSIDEVLGEGFDLVDVAAKSPAGNNLNYSSSTRNLLNISDGDQRLFVEYTTKRVVVKGEPFTLKYKFLPTKDSATPINVRCTDGTPDNNDPITIKIKSVTGKEGVIQNIAYNDNPDENGYSTIIITPKNTLPTTGYWQEEIEITSTYSPLNENGQPSDSKVTLSRIVTLYMLEPYALEVSCTPEVNREINASVQLNINIPSNLEPDLFPLIFDIEAQDLSIYPDASADYFIDKKITMPVVTGQSIIEENTSTDNVFRFQRKVTLEEYEELKGSNSGIVVIPCYFKTNVAASATTIHVYNEYFNRGNCSFSNPELPLEMSATLEGEQYYGAGKTVTLNLTTNKPGTYTVTFTEVGASSSSTTAPITVNAGSTSGSTTYTTQTWSGKVTASVQYKGNAAGGTNPVPVEGSTRNVLVLGKMTAGSNPPSDNKNVTIYSASGSNLRTATWSQLKAGGVEVTIDNLADNMDTDAVYFQYTGGNWYNPQTYKSGTLKVNQAISGSKLNF